MASNTKPAPTGSIHGYYLASVPPPTKKRRINPEESQRKTIPRLISNNIRNHSDVHNPGKNPLIHIHKAQAIKNVIESIRLYSKINKFCIGKETKSSKKIYITSQSAYSGLCSKDIAAALSNKHPPCQLPLLSFCLMNYNCGCFRNPPSPTRYGIYSTFTIPLELRTLISNCNYPSTVIAVEINGDNVGHFFVKTAAPLNLKRMAQPSTFHQFRMSITRSVQLRSITMHGLQLLIKSRTNSDEYGLGIGYYFTARSPYAIDIVCCILNMEDTEFVIRCDQNLTPSITSIRLNMHMEDSPNTLKLFEYIHKESNHNTNIMHRSAAIVNPPLNVPYATAVRIPCVIPKVPLTQTMYVLYNNNIYPLSVLSSFQ